MEVKKIKVAMLGPYLEEIRRYSSIAIHTNLLTKHLSKIEDIELHVITIGNEDGRFKKDNVDIHVVKKSLLYPFCTPSFVWRLKHEIIEINPDIVHAVVSGTSYSTVVTLVQKKYPTLLSVRGIRSKEAKFNRGITRIFDMLIEIPNEMYVLSKVPNIIVCSPQMKEMVGTKTSSKIYVIPNGIDFDEIQKIRVEDRLKHPAILFMGTYSLKKGIDVLLNAVPIIRKEIPSLHVYIAGKSVSEEEDKNLKKLAEELNIEESVSFLGFISGAEKYAYYKSADIYVHPSRYEPFGVVLLEAMACGKPIVASRVGGIPFVVEDGETGLLFKSENVEELAEKVILLLRNKELRVKMGKAGRERAKLFTWERCAEMTVEVYKVVTEKFKIQT
jgi:glycosyltransferase involved in cell wall biosynthesis